MADLGSIKRVQIAGGDLANLPPLLPRELAISTCQDECLYFGTARGQNVKLAKHKDVVLQNDFVNKDGYGTCVIQPPGKVFYITLDTDAIVKDGFTISFIVPATIPGQIGIKINNGFNEIGEPFPIKYINDENGNALPDNFLIGGSFCKLQFNGGMGAWQCVGGAVAYAKYNDVVRKSDQSIAFTQVIYGNNVDIILTKNSVGIVNMVTSSYAIKSYSGKTKGDYVMDTLFTIPEIYRPKNEYYYYWTSMEYGYEPHRLNVTVNGNVNVVAVAMTASGAIVIPMLNILWMSN